MTPTEEKVIEVAVDISEAGRNIGFGELPSVMLHELYDAVNEMKRSRKMSEPGMDTGASRRCEEHSYKAAPPNEDLKKQIRESIGSLRELQTDLQTEFSDYKLNEADLAVRSLTSKRIGEAELGIVICRVGDKVHCGSFCAPGRVMELEALKMSLLRFLLTGRA